jgi:cobalt/nickel transport system permease protein
MTLALDYPTRFESLLARWDPRWKLAALLAATVAVALLRSTAPVLVALAATLGLVVLGRLPLRWYLLRVGTAALFVAFFVVWLPFLDEEGPFLDTGWFEVSVAGLRAAVLLLIKAVSLVSLMLVLWATAPLETTFKAAHALRFPGLLVQLILFTYRYMHLLGEELGRLRKALRVRGYRNRANLHSYRTVGHVTGMLLVRSYERAERVGQAMRCRGFDGRFRSLHDFRTGAGDVIAFVLILGSGLGLLVWDIGLRG